MTQTTAPAENTPLVLQMSPVIEMTDDQFFEFCQLNRDLRIERTCHPPGQKPETVTLT